MLRNILLVTAASLAMEQIAAVRLRKQYEGKQPQKPDWANDEDRPPKPDWWSDGERPPKPDWWSDDERPPKPDWWSDEERPPKPDWWSDDEKSEKSDSSDDEKSEKSDQSDDENPPKPENNPGENGGTTGSYPALEHLGGDANKVTFSGFSAGCQFSHTMHVIHSDVVKGVGLMNCGPYMSQFDQFVDDNFSTQDLVDFSLSNMADYEATGDIDSTSNFADSAVYIVSGLQDKVVPPKNQEAIKAIYENNGVGMLKYEELPDTKHNMENGQSEKLLTWLFTELGWQSEFNAPADDALDYGTFTEFDQREFVEEDDFESTTFKENGYVYMPNSCYDKSCPVHFALHGCGASSKGWSRDSGYNEFAATNDLIVVWPDSPCWDNHGDVDADNYGTASGIFPKAFMKIIERVTSAPLI